MAGLTVWTAATIGLLLPLLLAIIGAGHGPAAGRMVALQLVGSIAVLMMVVLCFVDDQASSIDLALALALLSLPAALLFALFEERWL